MYAKKPLYHCLHLGVDKEHYYDACTIATQGNAFNVKSNIYKKKCVSDGDFQKTKGIRSEQPIVTDKICGFRKFDKVRYSGVNPSLFSALPPVISI